ncbi:MAG TPA: hypothetical protein DCM28_00095 [Phycisphaerales bacterium]|nr:hypothetical protein [Phycisphaerales bacterium]HCD30929.1 hypothetical protein [Phycisphaerales bacterium]|tara:strand:+ start:418 stop:2433 length:2016 start_codon:yes stop_codon:yes gene_type:complete
MKLRTYKALFWKEWLEARWGLYVGLILFLALPIIETVTKYQHVTDTWVREHGRYQPSAQSELLYVVNFCGCFYALILAVAMVCHDMNTDDSPEPWRILPVKSSTFISMKFFVGLMVLLSVWLLVMGFDAIMMVSVQIIGTSSFTHALIYSLNRVAMGVVYLAMTVSVYALSFLLSVWHRRAISSAIISAVAGVLLCFLPLLVPVLDSLNIWKIARNPMYMILDKSHPFYMHVEGNLPYNIVKILGRQVIINKEQWWFLAFAAVLIVSSVILVRLVVSRHWQLKLNATQMSWLFVIVGMGLLGLATHQVGNNLEPEQIIPFAEHMTATNITMSGEQGMALTRGTPTGNEGYDSLSRQLHSIDLKRSDPLSNDKVDTGQKGFAWPDTLQRIAWSPDHPDIAYVIQADMYQRQNQWRYSRVMLKTVQYASQGKANVISKMDISKTFYDPSYEYGMPGVYLDDKTLWLYYYGNSRAVGLKLQRYDLADPQSPELVDTYQIKGNFYQIGVPFEREGKVFCSIKWPQVKGISDSQMWGLIENLRINLRPYHVTSDRIIQYEDKVGLLVYQRQHSDKPAINGQPAIEYQLISQLNLSPLAKLLEERTVTWLLEDGYLYVLIDSSQSGMTVYNMRDIKNIKQIGYYYAPGDNLHSLTSLGDGRIAAAGRKLHIFNPKTW